MAYSNGLWLICNVGRGTELALLLTTVWMLCFLEVQAKRRARRRRRKRRKQTNCIRHLSGYQVQYWPAHKAIGTSSKKRRTRRFSADIIPNKRSTIRKVLILLDPRPPNCTLKTLRGYCLIVKGNIDFQI